MERKTKGWVAVASLLLFAACGGGGKERQQLDVIETLDMEAEALPQGEDVFEPDSVGPDETGAEADSALDLEVPFFCKTDDDCKDHTVGQCQRPKCDVKTGKCGFEWVQNCALDAVLFSEDFEQGMPEGWTIDDTNPLDFVTWRVDDKRSAFGKYSLYLGDPRCHTYFNGTLDEECRPSGESSLVRVSITTPKILVPPTKGKKVLSFYLWLDSEPLHPGEPVQPDLFRVLIRSSDNSVEVFNSVDINKTTSGDFIFVTADLDEFTGSEIQVRFSFDTLDGTDNFYEGVYLDNVVVQSVASPKTCTEGEKCPDDGNVCTDDNCSLFYNKVPSGYCGYPLIPSCVKPECTEATVAQDCPNAGQCEEAKCVSGKCVYEPVPGCCTTKTLLDANFDDSSLQGFQVYAYQGESKVKWWVVSKRSHSGCCSLYYGNKDLWNYDTPGTFNFGEATSPPIDIPPDGNVFLSFYLYLSTEFDDTVPENYYNPLGVDFFEVLVVENLGDLAKEKETQVWTSNNIYGTTGGQFLGVGIDLTDFAGKRIWIRFKFSTSDEHSNNYEGVYVDDVKVEWTPASEGCPPRRNCMGPYDCGIDGVCKIGECKDQVCITEAIGVPPECCASPQDCDDKNPCTTDGCVNHKCLNEPVEGPGCCFPETLKTFDFDTSPLEGFQVVDDGTIVKWQTTSALYHSPPNALYFGNGTNYDNGSVASGSALSPEIVLPVPPPEGKIFLSFYLYLDVDPNPIFDLFKVEVVEPVSGQKTVVFTKAMVPQNAYKTWFQVDALDISAFKGKKVKVRFSFDSVDQVNNSGFGVVVDDIVIRKVCLTQ